MYAIRFQMLTFKSWYLLYVFCIVRGTHLSMKELVDQETLLIDNLHEYIEAEQLRIEELQNWGDTLKRSIELYETDDNLAWNPLAIYKTVKYLIVDFENVQKTMIKKSDDDSRITRKVMEEKTIFSLDENHVHDEVRELVNLQRKLNLSVLDVMDGRLTQNSTVNSTLTPEDCFYIGKKSAEKHDHETAVDWLQGCEDRFNTTIQDQAYKILISSALYTGDKQLCRKILNKCLRTDHNNRILNDLNIKLSLQFGNWNHDTEKDQWESFNVCAGDYANELASKHLKCRYNHRNSPFLTIAPLKEEILSLVPKISVFREAVYESEIEKLKHDSYNSFRVAKVVTRYNTSQPDLQYRPSQTTFLPNNQPKFKSLWNRLEDMSSLSLRRGENFQMLHYAPGGFYRVHGDYFRPSLNDVHLGGETVFPRLKLGVQPVKGSVLFWINMRVDGSEETYVRHAACPVIYGEKLACTQWFRIGGQDHWIAEPEDDTDASYSHSINPNIICRKRPSRP